MSKRTIVQTSPYGDVVDSREVSGIEMGVFQDGTVFLSARGLAAMCGVAPSTIIEWAQAYDPESGRPRDAEMAELMRAQGYDLRKLHFSVTFKSAQVHAYPEPVCIAVLSYYARTRLVAQQNLARLARNTLRQVVYKALGYDEERLAHRRFIPLHERVLLNAVPEGYFNVFAESIPMVVKAIKAGLHVDRHTIPDISVGKLWAQRWTAAGLASKYGERQKFPHKYPEHYPQGQADVEAWVYPLDALGEFRRWLEAEYIPLQLPRYLDRKVRENVLAPATATRLLTAVRPVRRLG